MCGIVGYIGKNDTTKILLNGLKEKVLLYVWNCWIYR